MSLDTAIKRLGALVHGRPWIGMLPFPAGSVGAFDRMVVASEYPLDIAGSLPEGSYGVAFTLRRKRPEFTLRQQRT